MAGFIWGPSKKQGVFQLQLGVNGVPGGHSQLAHSFHLELEGWRTKFRIYIIENQY